jgi:hypothetical protein
LYPQTGTCLNLFRSEKLRFTERNAPVKIKKSK